MDDPELRHLLGKARDAKRGGMDAWRAQSTGEKVAVALVLNEPSWLDAMGYTLPEAIDRTGPTWILLVPKVAKMLADE